MKVSLLIPVYNCLPYLTRAFDSFMNQTLADMEVVVVDDHSTDGSYNWLQELSKKTPPERLRLYRHEQNRGVAAARNTLLAKAQGEYTFFVDADDWLELDAMEKMLDEAERTGADMVSCDQLLHYEDRTESVSLPLKETGIANIKAVWNGELVGGLSHVLVRRSLYKKAGASFIEGADYAEDLQAKVKLFLATDKFAYVPEAFYHYDQTNTGSVSHRSSAKKVEGRFRNVISILETLESRTDNFHELIHQLKIEARSHAIRLRYEFGNAKYDLATIYPDCSHWYDIASFRCTTRMRLYMILVKLGLGCLISFVK